MNWLRSISLSSGLLVPLFLTVALVSQSLARDRINPEIKITYPKPNQVIGAVDSTFLFGHIAPRTWKSLQLKINGTIVEIHKEGGFLAFVAIEPGEFSFFLELYDTDNRSEYLKDTLTLTVSVPEPIVEIPEDSLAIAGDYQPPPAEMILNAGETVEVAFRGTPGLTAWATVEGIVDLIPMSESAPRLQPYWGENVFGRGTVPDSLRLRGIYTGRLVIPANININQQRVTYHLARPKLSVLAAAALRIPSLANHIRLLRFMDQPEEISANSSWRLTTNSPDFPFAVRFTDSVQIIRHEPGMGYFAIFQPEGIETLAVGQMGDWYKLRLSESQTAWCETAKVERLEKGTNPPRSYPAAIRTHSFDDSVAVEIALRGKHPFQITELDRHTISLRLFGVTGNTDWIRYDAGDPSIDFITWNQPKPEVYELLIKTTSPVWGYETHYEGNTLFFTLHKPPRQTWRLRGKKIVIDPGHSSDVGAVGPTGLTEAEANLNIAVILRRLLESEGVEVIMTRDDMSHVDLYGRPAIAKASDADLFVSIHNNALPDGVNPFENNGVSTYYYHLHSLDLARSIQTEMVQATSRRDHGLYYGNLAVNRPTQYPAVLVECAFMMIPEQEAGLKDYWYRKKIAQAIANGIANFLENYQ